MNKAPSWGVRGTSETGPLLVAEQANPKLCPTLHPTGGGLSGLFGVTPLRCGTALRFGDTQMPARMWLPHPGGFIIL